MKLLFVANVDWYVISHRIKIIQEAVKNGWDVTVACENTGKKDIIINTGAKFIDFPFSRSGTNPFKELVLLRKFYVLYKNNKADVIHHVSLKPVIYGSFVAKILKKPTVLNAVSGLGYAFTGKHKGTGSLQKVMRLMMRYAFKRKNLSFIFQNKEDHQELIDLGAVYKNNIIYFIKGSGVDLNEYQPSYKSIENSRVVILFPARMLWDKGVRELRQATEILKPAFFDKITFVLAGKANDDNKASVPKGYLTEWSDGSYVDWIGHSDNMVKTFQESDIVVLPSYREGMPKSLIEAAAMGKPIVTTDTVGCKDCVADGVNGYLVPLKDEKKLAEALKILINNKELRTTMGRASRQKAELEFDYHIVVNEHLKIYQELLNLIPKSQQIATTTP